MDSRKMTGITLMVALAVAFLAWNLRASDAAVGTIARMAISGLLALGIFAAWRFLVWKKPD